MSNFFFSSKMPASLHFIARKAVSLYKSPSDFLGAMENSFKASASSFFSKGFKV